MSKVAIDWELFKGKDEISLNDAIRCQISNFTSDVGIMLTEFQWDKKTLVACMGLAQGENNRTIVASQFLIRVKLEEKGYHIKASNLWAEADPTVMLVIRIPKVEIFQFSEGGLYFDLVDCSQVQHTYFTVQEKKAPAPILAADLAEWEIGDFSMRLFCYTTRVSSDKTKVVLKWVLAIYPEGKEAMVATWEHAQNPSWPGIDVVDGKVVLAPPTHPPGAA